MQMYLKEIKGVISKNILKSVNRFNSTIKINNYSNRGEKKGKKKKSRSNYRTSKNIRIMFFFDLSCQCLLPHCESPSTPGCPPVLGWSLHLLQGKLRL